MQLITKFNKGIRFLICAIDSFSIYAWVISLKDKKGLIITNIFQNIFDESNRKPNKICVVKLADFIRDNEIMTRKKCHRNVFNI